MAEVRKDISNIFLALGYLAQEGSDQFRNCLQSNVASIKNLYRIFNTATVSVSELSQIVIAHYRLLYFAGISLGDTSTLEARLDRPTPNHLQNSLTTWLTTASALPKECITLEALICGYFVDCLITRNGKKIILELDGPQHYDKEGKLTPEDALRDALLTKAGYTVYRIKNEKVLEIINGKAPVDFDHFLETLSGPATTPKETTPTKDQASVTKPKSKKDTTDTPSENGMVPTPTLSGNRATLFGIPKEANVEKTEKATKRPKNKAKWKTVRC